MKMVMFRPKKMFGQNFLTDKNIAGKIVKSAGIHKGDIVWEIGAGQGILTEQLLKTGCSLICFEIDRELISFLQKEYSDKITLVPKDILKTDWQKLINQHRGEGESFEKINMVANIPYNITSPLLYKLTDYAAFFRRIILMLQKEVAERLTATPGTKSYGVLSLKVQHHFKVSRLFRVPRHLFRPQPSVDSVVVNMIPRADSQQFNDPEYFWQIVETAFSSRRKTLKNNLSKMLSKQELQMLDRLMQDGNNNQKLPDFFEHGEPLDFDLTSRGESLDEKDFCTLYHLIEHVRNLS